MNQEAITAKARDILSIITSTKTILAAIAVAIWWTASTTTSMNLNLENIDRKLDRFEIATQTEFDAAARERNNIKDSISDHEKRIYDIEYWREYNFLKSQSNRGEQ